MSYFSTTYNLSKDLDVFNLKSKVSFLIGDILVLSFRKKGYSYSFEGIVLV